MFAYYLELGLRSLRRNPALTALMVMAIGFGVAASMTTYAVFRAVSGNPIPERSSQLFVPQIDNWGPQSRKTGGDLPESLSYTDAMALMHAHKATKQTAIYPVGFTLVPVDPKSQPFAVKGYAAYADFFAMFDVPFQYGGGWQATDDENRANAVVMSAALNQKIFAGANSVGREIQLDGRDYRIVGVLADWDPRPRFYDVNNGSGFGDAPDVFMPFTRAVDLHTETQGNNNCYGTTGQGPGWDGWLHSECVWISFWVELPDTAAVTSYRSYLEAYAADQRHAGRFHWAPAIRLSNLTQWLDREHVVPRETTVSLVVALGFLLVCLVNTIGLLLAKFMRRASEIGVRRALGASRRQIYTQFLTEAAVVGIAGGLLGLALTAFGLLGIDLVFEPEIARLAQLNIGLVGFTLLVSIAATVVAGFYPTWRAARVQPAWQLRSN
jgi:putative ABC transport system permease protein